MVMETMEKNKVVTTGKTDGKRLEKKSLEEFLAETNVSKTGLAWRRVVKDPLVEILDMQAVVYGLYPREEE